MRGLEVFRVDLGYHCTWFSTRQSGGLQADKEVSGQENEAMVSLKIARETALERAKDEADALKARVIEVEQKSVRLTEENQAMEFQMNQLLNAQEKAEQFKEELVKLKAMNEQLQRDAEAKQSAGSAHKQKEVALAVVERERD